MTTLEWVEFGFISVAAVAVYYFSYLLPNQLQLGLAVVWLAALVFLQSLVRDLSLLWLKRGGDAEQQEKQCMCLESIIGVSVLLFGFLLFFIGSSNLVSLNNTTYTAAIFITLICGFLIKDFVIGWRPLAIWREKNHMNIIVRW